MHQTTCRLLHSVREMRHLPPRLFYPFSFVLDPHGRYVVISPLLGKGSSSNLSLQTLTKNEDVC